MKIFSTLRQEEKLDSFEENIFENLGFIIYSKEIKLFVIKRKVKLVLNMTGKILKYLMLYQRYGSEESHESFCGKYVSYTL